MEKTMDESRLKHSLAVARKMVEIGREYNLMIVNYKIYLY